MSEIPKIDKSLIDILDRNFPDKAPDISATDREVWVRVGAVMVVRFLKAIKDEQDENILR